MPLTPSIPQGFGPVDVVYHGSSNPHITLFEPQSTKVRDFNEGPVVFATPSLALASCFLVPWDDSWVHQFVSWHNDNPADYHVVMVIADKERFLASDHGGSIYLLPARGFQFDAAKGLGMYEWTSNQPARVLTQLNVPSALDAMTTFGVQVYFVTPQQLQYFRTLKGADQEAYLQEL